MKKIMLSVLGLSPQVLTETLYALFKEGRLVDEIHVITTSTGKDLVHSGLLASGEGHFFKFLEEYGIPRDKISFPPQNIHVLRDESGQELDDIVSPEDHEALVKTCMGLAWQLTSQPHQTVYFMIAGGRKTMSASLALAAQFYGRPDDRIFHVLVSPEFEHSREFYYPPLAHRLVATKDKNGKTVYRNTKDAKIWLISMPFISVRDRLASKDLEAPKNPEVLISSLIRDNQPRLIIDLNESKVIFKDRQVDLPHTQIAVLAFFASLRLECRCEVDPEECDHCFLSWEDIEDDPAKRSRIKGYYEKVKSGELYNVYLSDSGIKELEYQNFSTYRSKLNGALQKAFGGYAKEIIIDSVGPKTEKRYGIRLSPKFIEIRL